MISVRKGKTMSNDRCRFVILSGLGWFFILAPACGQSDRTRGGADAARTIGDAATADVSIFTGNDAGPDAARDAVAGAGRQRWWRRWCCGVRRQRRSGRERRQRWHGGCWR